MRAIQPASSKMPIKSSRSIDALGDFRAPRILRRSVRQVFVRADYTPANAWILRELLIGIFDDAGWIARMSQYQHRAGLGVAVHAQRDDYCVFYLRQFFEHSF